jgi:hypothetical protein
MKPKAESTSFGSITIDGQRYEHDVLVRLSGRIEKRKKKLSKRQYGTSHKISLAEAEHIYEQGAEVLVIGTGQYDQVRLSEEAQTYFNERGLRTVSSKTPDALTTWNDEKGQAIGLFHVTC